VTKTNYWSILVAAVAAFLFSSFYYSPLLLGAVWRTVDPVATAAAKASAAKALFEFVRTLVITLVIARVLAMLQVLKWKSAVQIVLLLWFGFSAMMWVGAIMWEKTPWPVAAIHSGDWLVKTVLIAFILGVWHR
jgi:hypothetical protein